MSKERRGIHLIAELAHVSIGTVDRALHRRAGIKEATRQRILQIARQVGYTPNLAARLQGKSACAYREKSIFSMTSFGPAFSKRLAGPRTLEFSS